MISYARRKEFGQFSVIRVKRQEMNDRALKVLDIFGLDFLAPFGVRLLSFGETFGGSFSCQVSLNLLDDFLRREHSAREDFAPFFLLDHPVFAGRFHATSQGGIPRG